MATRKNEYGEEIHVKIENDVIMVHHEDCTDDFIDISKFLSEMVIDVKELILIHSAIKEEYMKSDKFIKMTKKFDKAFSLKK